MSELVIADKDLGLYSLAETKNKTMVQYPDPFSGTLGENVFRFIKDRQLLMISFVRPTR